jgi:hypothetical protein
MDQGEAGRDIRLKGPEGTWGAGDIFVIVNHRLDITGGIDSLGL